MTHASKTTFQVIQEIWSRFAKPFKGLFVVAIFLMIVVAASGAIYPAIMQQVFNHLAGEQTIFKYNFLIIVPSSIICIALVKAIAMYLQILTVNRFAQSIATALQSRIMSHLVVADLSFTTRYSSGAFISKIMNDVNLIKEAAVRLSNNLIRDLLTIFVMIGMLFWFDFWLSILVLAIYPIAFQPILLMGRKQRSHAKRLQVTMEEVTSIISEIISGSKMIKAFQLEEGQKLRASLMFEKLKIAYLSLLSGRARIDPILEVLGGIAIAGVVAVAAWRISNGEMLVGDVVGFSAIPGSDRVYNHNKGAWENTYNEAPNNAYLGWGVYVTNRVEGDSKKRKAAWSAAAHIGGKDLSLWTSAYPSGFQPYRNSHFNYDEWEAAGYDRAFVEDYLGSNLDTYNHPNSKTGICSFELIISSKVFMVDFLDGIIVYCLTFKEFL